LTETSAGHNGLDDGARPCGQGPRVKPPVAHPFGGRENEVAGRGPDDARATATVTWCGCRRGESFEGCSAIGNGHGRCVSQCPGRVTTRPSSGECVGAPRQRKREPLRRRGAPGVRSSPRGKYRETRRPSPETWRTPWSAAGCNRPATYPAEQTVEVGRNGKDGTRSKGGIFEPMGANESQVPSSSEHEAAGGSSEPVRDREWTLERHVDGGAIIDNPMRGVPIPNGSCGSGERTFGPVLAPARPERETDRANRKVSLKERRRSRGPGLRSPDPRRNRKGSPTQVRAISHEAARDHGGHVEKANDPQPRRLPAEAYPLAQATETSTPMTLKIPPTPERSLLPTGTG